jgi:hypothetical protein
MSWTAFTGRGLALCLMLCSMTAPAAPPKTPAPAPRPAAKAPVAPRPAAAPNSPAPVLRTFHSQHYTLHTDFEPGFAQDVARRMDAMYDEYSRRLDSLKPVAMPQRHELYLFARQSDYVRFVGAAFGSTGGAYIPGRNVIASFLEKQGHDAVRRTLQHEAFHQFAEQTFAGNLPIWLNEGMAQYFEEGLWTEAGFLLGQVSPHRLRQLQSDIKAGRLTPFDRFTTLSAEEWSGALSTRGQTRGMTQYNQAWAMVYFLINASDEAGQPLYRARFLRMLQLLRDGAKPQAALEQCFSANYEGFQKHFVAFASRVQASPEASYIERQEVLADMLIAARERNWAANDLAELQSTVAARKVSINYSRGQIHWTSDPDTSIYFRALDGSRFHTSELYLSPRRGAPLPDIVCHYSPALLLRTRFYRYGEKTYHDTQLEPPPAPPLLASPRRGQ